MNKRMIGINKIMNSIAVIRADDMDKVRIAISDLVRYASLTFEGSARRIEPTFADNVLIQVMKSPLRMRCEAAAVIPLKDDASISIGRLRKIHPPAHVIIVSPRHEIFHELSKYIDILPEMTVDTEYNIPVYTTVRAEQPCKV